MERKKLETSKFDLILNILTLKNYILSKRITVSTISTIYNDNKYLKNFNFIKKIY